MTAINAFSLILTVQGMAKPIELAVPDDADVAHILARIREETGRTDIEELAFEDADEPLADAATIIEDLRREFRVLHASTRQRIKVRLSYEGQSHERAFRPNATIRRVIRWAISPEAFGLEGKPAQFQVKVDGRVVPPDTHLGQAAHGSCALEGVLVHNVKPQG
ncbi:MULTISPECIES: hypothetical protein [Sphingopyxis]|nr:MULTISPECIES: hypothetical protein [Sphingopyxis]GGJ59807.1 hypothetical protein GCM10011393_32700 [Sphingopyxis bauzanensis]